MGYIENHAKTYIMKHFLFSIAFLITASFTAANAQDNPCGVEGTVVEASNYQYAPSSLEISAGETVVWVNMGGFHDVNGVESSIDELWNNPETFSLDAINGSTEGTCIGFNTFTVEGTYNYDCSIGNHAEQGMVASVTVTAPPTNTVVDVIVNSEDHTLLELAVGAAGLVDALSGEGPFTVFAPTDAAIVALTEALGITAEDLLALPELGEILQYHVVGGLANSGDLSDGQMITTLLGQDVTISISDLGIFVNQAQVTGPDIMADNGVVHVIDAVLVPEEEELPETVVDIIVESDVHTLLEAAVIAADLVDALSGDGPFTVFAPTDAAIVALTEALGISADELLALPNLGEILQYHVVAADAFAEDLSDGQVLTTLLGEDVTVSIDGATVKINDATVILADLDAENGVVHVIDAVLLPPTSNISEENQTLECVVYPNPVVDGMLNVRGNWNAGAELMITDIQGRILAQSVAQSNVVTWDAGSFEAGVYTVTVLERNQRQAVQVVIR